MKKQKLLYFFQFFILLLLVGFYSWETTTVFGLNQSLWVVIPGGIFLLLFVLAFERFFRLPDRIFYIIKKLVEYFLAASIIFLFNHITLLFVNLFFDFPLRIIALISLSLSALMLLYGYLHARRIIVREVKLENEKIKDTYSFVQLSDIHLGSNNKKEVRNILKTLKSLSYDFVLLTGDIIDEDYANYRNLQLLSSIPEPMYFITGNHEYNLENKDFRYFIEKTDIFDLNNNKTSFGEIDLYGIDEESELGEVLDDLDVDKDRCSLCLVHEPYYKKLYAAENRGIDYIFCGHTHSGQFFPLTLIAPILYRFLRGKYQIEDMVAYVNSGTGTWGPKIRIGTSNEITLFTLGPKK